MTTKLTLSVDSLVIERAKGWAKGRQTSVSALVEDYLSLLVLTPSLPEQVPAWAGGLYGACKSSGEWDDTEALVADLVAEKHA